MLNAIYFSPKTAVTVVSPASLAPSFTAFCRPSQGQAHHWLLSLNWRLFHLFISAFLPSLSRSPLRWLIIPPLQKKPPPVCRRGFYCCLFPQSLAPHPRGLQETALKATTKTEEVHSIVSSILAKSLYNAYIFRQGNMNYFILLTACIQLSVSSHDSYQTK